jgi:hypothetical protein
MNWKFWQKEPVVPVPVMTQIERWLLDDITSDPAAWSVRAWQNNAVRADSRGATILSSAVARPAVVGPFGLHQRPNVVSAACGTLSFSKEFAERWHKTVSARLKEAQETARQAEEAKVTKYLVDVFGPA